MANEFEDKIDISNLSLNLLAESDLLANEQEKDDTEFSRGSDVRNEAENFDSTEPKYSNAIEDTKQDSKYFRKGFNFTNDFPNEMDKYLSVIPHKDGKSIKDSSSLKSMNVEKFDTTQKGQFVI